MQDITTITIWLFFNNLASGEDMNMGVTGSFSASQSKNRRLCSCYVGRQITCHCLSLYENQNRLNLGIFLTTSGSIHLGNNYLWALYGKKPSLCWECSTVSKVLFRFSCIMNSKEEGCVEKVKENLALLILYLKNLFFFLSWKFDSSQMQRKCS